MRTKEAIQAEIEKVTPIVEALGNKYKDAVRGVEQSIKTVVADLIDKNPSEIFVRFSIRAIEIGLEDVPHFKSAGTFYTPDSVKSWQLNFGSVGSIDKDSPYTERTILLGIMAQQLKTEGLLIKTMERSIETLNSIEQEIVDTGLSKLKHELYQVEVIEREKAQKKIDQTILDIGVVESEVGVYTMIRENGDYDRIVKIEIDNYTDKTITARYYCVDGFSQTYRGNREFVLGNLRKLYSVSLENA